jgi:hypothetical protein
MATTRHFCLAADLTARLSPAGLVACADDDGDGAVSATDRAAAVDPCIQYATNLIETALLTAGINVPLYQADSALNPLLKDIAVDIALHRLMTRRGAGSGQSTIDAHDMAIKTLDKIAGRKFRVPGLTYPGEIVERRSALGRPVAANPCKGG